MKRQSCVRRLTQRGFAATEEDPPNDAKKSERFRVRGQKPGISPFWRHLADHFFSPLRAPKWPREKSSQAAMNLPYIITEGLQCRPRFVSVGALLVGMRDLKNARFIERFAEQLQTDRQLRRNWLISGSGICKVTPYTNTRYT